MDEVDTGGASDDIESVGAGFYIAGMLEVRKRTRDAIEVDRAPPPARDGRRSWASKLPGRH